MKPHPHLLAQLVCPQTHEPLVYQDELQELWCFKTALAYPIQNGIPLMVLPAARPLTEEEMKLKP